MRALLALVLLLGAPAAAAARPLDADRSFARAGIFRMDEPIASYAVVALRDGGTLHATDGAGMLRLSARGRHQASAFLQPAGVSQSLVRRSGGALVLGQAGVEYGRPTPLGVWRVDHDGNTLAHHAIALPGGESAWPLRIVRGRGRYFALARSTRSEPPRTRIVIVAIRSDGALDEEWGDGGFRTIRAGETGLAVSPRDGSLVIAQTLQTRCRHQGYSGRTERARLRVTRLSRSGERRWSRTTAIGGRDECPLAEVGDVIDEGARIVVAGGFGRSTVLLALRADGRRNPRFGRRGVASLRADGYWTPTQVLRRRGGYAFAYSEGDSAPSAVVGLIDRRGRGLRRRRLKVTRNYPSSAVHDIAIDRRGGIVAAGQLHDTDLFIREDYGQPHLAVWRVRTR